MNFRLSKSKVLSIFIIGFFIGVSFASGINFDEQESSSDTFVLSLFYESTSGETIDQRIVESWYSEPVRWQEVDIRQEIFDITRQNKGDIIQLNVFDDNILTGTITNVIEYIKGTKTVYGSINEEFYGTFVIAITDDTCLITIRIPSKKQLFITQFDSTNDIHYAIELDINLYQDEVYAVPLMPPDEDELSDGSIHDTFGEDDLSSLDASNSQTNTNIDVMIVYTPEAETWANQAGGGIYNVVSTAMANSQIVLDNSQTYVTMRLVYSGVVDYEESGDNGLDLSRLTYGSGNMTEVHEWRDQYGADLVKILTRSGNYGGVAWMPRTAQGSPDLGFSLTRVHLAAMTYTPIHEMGHNMGCHHHKEQNFQPGPGVFPYSAGWRWIGNDSVHYPYYCTVMTYTSGMYFEDGRTHTQVPYFSNPDVYYKGFPTGHSSHGDNARTIREIRHVISAYRPETGIVPNAGGPYVAQTGEEIQFTGNVLGGVEPYSWEWDFGDGSVSTIESPIHTYNYVGSYFITLTITDEDGKKSIDRTTATIFGEGDLVSHDSLRLGRLRQGWRTSKSFTLANRGDPGSSLDWEILSYPDRGTWTFRPSSGIGLTPEDGEVTVKVTMIVPTSHRLFEWFRDEIVIQNKNNPAETCVIPVSMIILRNWRNWIGFE